MKSIYTKILLLLIAALLPLAAEAGPKVYKNKKNGAILEYNIEKNENGKYIEIIGANDAENIEIPSEIKGIPVKRIGEEAFRYKKNLKSILIPESIISISIRAFDGCSSLTSVNIPKSVTTIGSNMFRDCSSLSTVNIPDSFSAIPYYAFSGCSSLTTINIPSSVTEINKSAFNGCSSLTTINIPNSVTEIGEAAFKGCSSLTTLNIPNSVTYIDEAAFEDCSSLTTINIPNSVKYIWRMTFKGCSSLTAINIPNSVTIIGNEAFKGCSSLTEIIIPNSVEAIGDMAFGYCKNLTSIVIPESIYMIDSSFILGCDKLTTVYNYSSVDLSNCSLPSRAKIITDRNYADAGVPATAVSGVVKQELPRLAVVEGSIKFVDPDGSNAIDCGQTCFVEFDVKNSGKGSARNCVAKAVLSGTKTGLSAQNVSLAAIAPGATEHVRIPIKSTEQLANGRVNIAVVVTEPHGLDTDEFSLACETRAFVAPNVLLADYSITSENGSVLAKKAPFKLQVLVQNASTAPADGVKVELGLPANVLLVDGDIAEAIGRLAPGETRSMEYELMVNARYEGSQIPINVKLCESHGKYATPGSIALNLSQPMAAKTIDVKSAERVAPGHVELAQIKGATKQSAVDSNIPAASTTRENTFAVIIANENYRYEEPVQFASTDGLVLSEYFNKTLGIPQSNIKVYADATLNDMRNGIDWLTQIDRAYRGDASMIVYYAGHGLPDEKQLSSYLVPTDGTGRNPRTCLAMSEITRELGDMQARNVVMILDACFSGSKRGEGMLATGSRGVSLAVRQEPLSGNVVMLSAAQGDETAWPLQREGHGMFTYHLLKKLQETKGCVTLGELADYLTTEVPRSAVREVSKPQTPTATSSPTVANTWRSWTLE